MTDVELLREYAGFNGTPVDMRAVLFSSADRIEKLEAALKKIAQHDMQAIAMDALRPGERIRKTLEGKENE
jgi:hypothetical protein